MVMMEVYMTKDRSWALVTGASSGIGKELALVFARNGWNLALVGRDSDRLEESADAARKLGAETSVAAIDLAEPSAVEALTTRLGERGIMIDALANVAGFNIGADLAVTDVRQLVSLLRTNVEAPTLLTRAMLPGMLARRRGWILNVGSTGSFFPTPHCTVYCASKAYVLSLTEALAEEVAGSGVKVTALCPGATRTRFADRAGVANTALFRKTMPPERVAELGYRALMSGKRVVVPGAGNALTVFSGRLMPRRAMVAIAGFMMRGGSGVD
jgi:uncharacterized protein